MQSTKLWWSYIAILAASALIYLFDRYTPRGTLTALLYVFPLLVALRLKQKYLYTAAPLFFTALTIIAALQKPSAGISAGVVVFNRSLAIIGFWFTAVLSWRKDVADEKLMQNANRLTLAQQAARIGTFELDIRTGVNSWSPELEAIHGLPPGGFQRTQKAWENLVHPDDRREVLRLAERASETGKPVDGEWRVQWPDGSIHWIYARSQAFKDETGRPVRLIGVNIDITERREAEEALRNSEHRLRRFFESGLLGVIYWNMKGEIEDANDKFLEMTGYTREDLRAGRIDWIDMTPEEYRHLDERSVAELKSTGINRKPFEKEYVRNDGTRIPIMLAGAMLDEARFRGVAFVLDITERRKAEAALREREEDSAQAQTIAHLGNWQLDPKTMTGSCSDEFFRILGIARPRVFTFDDFLKSVHPDDRAIPGTDIPEMIRTGKPRTADFRIRRPGGEVRYVHADGGCGVKSGKEMVFGILQDTTERRKSEEELRRARELAEKRAAEAEKGRKILNSITKHIQEGLTIADAPDGRVSMVSEYGLKLLDRPKEEVCGITSGERPAKWGIYHKDGTTMAKPEELPLARSIEKGEVVSNEEWMIAKPDGSLRQFSFTSAPIRNAENRITGAVSSWRDITEQVKTEEKLRRNEYELRSLIDNSPDLIFRVGREMRYVYVNPAYERLTGLRKEQFHGKTNSELGMSQQHIEFWQSHFRNILETGREFSVDFEMSGFFGKRYFLARLIPEYAQSGLVETVLVIARDITERKHAEEQMRYVSFHDEVTGLYNRAFFEEELRRMDTERELPVSIIMGDVNYLKLSNDVFGHQEGDLLLKTIADAIRKACRKGDITARWGGDEFAVILPKTDLSTADTVVCARIKQIAGESEGTAVCPSIALGVAAKERKDQNIYQVVRRAEERMYENKTAESKENACNVFSSLQDRLRGKTRGMARHIDEGNALARVFGKALKLEEEQLKSLLLLIEMHDIGFAIIPESILAKPGRLSTEEWELLKKHAEAGYRIVKSFPDTAKISNEVLSHDEHWDGTGYPRGLKGNDIPYLARVFALIEAYDVMTHERPYARAFTRDEAIEELRRNSGKQFDPGLVKAFIGIVQPGVPEKARA